MSEDKNLFYISKCRGEQFPFYSLQQRKRHGTKRWYKRTLCSV